MTLYIASEHAGFLLKEQLKKYLKINGHTVNDLGADSLKPNDDYPLYAKKLANTISKDPSQKGILLCGSGQGVCITANRQKNVRAALAWDEKSASASRSDDDANILCLGARLITLAKAKRIIDAWLKTPFSKLARHKRRIAQIDLKD